MEIQQLVRPGNWFRAPNCKAVLVACRLVAAADGEIKPVAGVVDFRRPPVIAIPRLGGRNVAVNHQAGVFPVQQIRRRAQRHAGIQNGPDRPQCASEIIQFADLEDERGVPGARLDVEVRIGVG